MSNTQKVVIPKGLVKPGETTIVEIPTNLKNVGTVVARPRPPGDLSQSYGSSSGGATPKMVKKRSFTRKTWPPKKHRGYGMLHDAGVTWGGRPNESDSTMNESSIGFQNPNPPRNRYAEISDGSVEYRGGHIYGGGFMPRLVHCSTPQDIDYKEGSLYRDFRPRLESSRLSEPSNDPGWEPRSVRKYSSRDQSSSMNESAPESYFKSEVTTSNGNEVQTEVTEESYYDYEPDPSTTLESSCPCSSGSGNESSGAYKRFDSSYSDSSGIYANRPPPQTPRRITQREVMNSLGELEAVELSQIMGDLNLFQNARRRLVFDASSLASAADVSSDLLNSSGSSM